jgi:hypothetical protein
MPEYLATVRRAGALKVTENVVADSADEAVFTRQGEKAQHVSVRDYLLIRNLSAAWASSWQ